MTLTLTNLLAGIAAALAAAPNALNAIKSLIALLKPTVTDDAGTVLNQDQVLAAIDAAFSTWKGVEDTADGQIAAAGGAEPVAGNLARPASQ